MCSNSPEHRELLSPPNESLWPDFSQTFWQFSHMHIHHEGECFYIWNYFVCLFVLGGCVAWIFVFNSSWRIKRRKNPTLLAAYAASPEVWDINTVCFLYGFPKGTENVMRFNWLSHVLSADTIMRWERASVAESWSMRAGREKRATSTCSSGLREMLREEISVRLCTFKNKISVSEVRIGRGHPLLPIYTLFSLQNAVPA